MGQNKNKSKNRHTTKTKHNPEKANNTKHSKQNYPGSVTSYNTRPGNEVGLFYNAPEPTKAQSHKNPLNVNCTSYTI